MDLFSGLSEVAGKALEQAKKDPEKVNESSLNETQEIPNNNIEKPDTEAIEGQSLASLLEENREIQEANERNNPEITETNEVKEGLSQIEKKELKELTGWSDEIIENIGSWEEAEIYVKAGLKEVEINGKKCLIREDIDLDKADEDGITNRERMERGRPPINDAGEEIELHHIGQHQNSPLAELTMQEHRGAGNDIILHDKTKETEIDRIEFGKERREHWKEREESLEGGK